MTIVVAERDVPEAVLRLLATPVARAVQTAYFGARQGDGWLLATLWNEPPRPDLGDKLWGIALRGNAEKTLVAALVGDIAQQARLHGCTALVTDALPLGAPFDQALQACGFHPAARYTTVETTTLAAVRGMGLGVRTAALAASGWTMTAPRPDDLALTAALFRTQVGTVPPHLFALAEAPETAGAADQSWVLRRHDRVVAALVARRIDRLIDAQGLVCHPRWRAHRTFAWFMASIMSRWMGVADLIRFSYPDHNAGMADIARRVDAYPLRRQHDLCLPLAR